MSESWNLDLQYTADKWCDLRIGTSQRTERYPYSEPIDNAETGYTVYVAKSYSGKCCIRFSDTAARMDDESSGRGFVLGTHGLLRIAYEEPIGASPRTCSRKKASIDSK